MRRVPSALLWGILLVVIGVLALLSNLGVLGSASDIVWGALFLALGVAFLVVFAQKRDRWWALIPGSGALGLGLLVIFGRLMPAGTEAILFLGALGLGFLFIYLLRRDYWWALIPAGVLFSICLVVAASQQDAFDEGSLMLLGLGVTFAAVALLGKPSSGFRWAWIPAGVLGILVIAILLGSVGVASYVWPVAIIVVGAFFLLRAAMGKQTTTRPDEPPKPPEA
ncbi:MAG: hypothetical protein GX557_00970 [Chloroflexi bacterium]|nr:hypothetical protein [Chloroflexota bacterium]